MTFLKLDTLMTRFFRNCMQVALSLLIYTHFNHACAHDMLNIVDFSSCRGPIDRSGKSDVSDALAKAVTAENDYLHRHDPTCIYIPAGIYRVMKPPPMFFLNGCIKGDGPTQSIIILDRAFAGDLFSWSESWTVTSSGPTVTGLKIVGADDAKSQQNALMFYDRNDEVFIDRVDIEHVRGRAIYSGVVKNTVEAFMRESTISNLRLVEDGLADAPVMEFNSQGKGNVDATNQIHIDNVDIYGSRGSSFVIRNNGTGVVRGINISQLRVEGTENGSVSADLVDIGDQKMGGGVANIDFSQIQLSDPYKGYAAMRMTAPAGGSVPYFITVTGGIGGGLAFGQGLRIDAGRASSFRFSDIHTKGTNVVLGPNVGRILLDGQGLERDWTYSVDKSSTDAIRFPVTERPIPTLLNTKSD